MYSDAHKTNYCDFLMQPKDDQKYFHYEHSDDYDRFVKGEPSYAIDELKQRIPEKYHSTIEVFLK